MLSYPIKVSHLSFNFLSAVTLGIYLGGKILLSANQCWGYVTFGADPDTTPFFIDFKNAKKNFHILFLQLAHRHIIFSQKNLIFC
jgi:hypothetical protein